MYLVLLTSLLVVFLLWEKSRKREDILSYYRPLLRLREDELKLVLGEGTRLVDGRLLYLTDYGNTGLIQSIFSIDQGRTSQIELKLEDLDLSKKVLKELALNKKLLEIKSYESFWELEAIEYRIKKEGDLVKISLKICESLDNYSLDVI